MQKITLAEALEQFAAQGVPSQRDYATVCPICGTVQSMNSLVKAGAAPETVERSFGFSCEGRFSGAGAWSPLRNGAVRGCDWTLGGLFQLHKLTLVQPDGSERPCFEIASPEQAQALAAAMIPAEAA